MCVGFLVPLPGFDMMKSAVKRRRYARLPVFVPLLLVLLAAVTGVRGLSNVTIDIPLAVAAGTTVNMTCKYDLQNDTLYTVKWYKGKEFYRYVPKELPPIAVFGALGEKVDVRRSDAHQVVLKDVQPNHSGKYKCEVSGDYPTFNTLMVYGYMHVAILPKGEPEIRIEKMRYAVGDTVRGNCTVPAGNPPANVTWSVNGIPVNASHITYKNVTDELNDNQQQITIATINYEVLLNSFSNGRLHIVCDAKVFNLYKEHADILLSEERPILASVLGTRESSYPGNAVRYTAGWLFTGAIATFLLLNLR